MIIFTAEILKPEKYPNAAYVLVPGDVKSIFGSLKPKVKIYYDSLLYRGSIANMGFGSMVIIPKDTEKREVEVPEPLLRELEKNNLIAEFNSLSYTNRKELARSIITAKRQETKDRRMQKALEFILEKSKKK